MSRAAVAWSEAEREAWAPPEELVPSAWCDKYRTLSPRSSAEPGPWRTDRTPYLREPLDAIADPEVEDLTVMACTQVGKTELGLNWLGYTADQDPIPTMVVLPRHADIETYNRGRLRPMFEDCPRLAKRIRPGRSSLKDEVIELDRMPIYLASAQSPADLAAKPCGRIMFEETDKFPKWAGADADPIELASERTKTFPTAKILKSSSPTTGSGYITRSFNAGDRRRYFVPCHRCGVFQVLYFPAVKWPETERNPDTIREERLAWYECTACGGEWTDADKIRANARGVWCPEGHEVKPDGTISPPVKPTRRRSYWINSLYSPWLTWSDIAAKFLSCKGEASRLMSFQTGWLAEPWEERVEEPTREIMATRKAGYKEGTVPAGGLVLIAGVDVQKDHFFAIVRAWGYGEESWLVRACRVESWDELAVTLFRTLYPRDKKKKADPLPVRLACIDSGHRTDEVYAFCRAHRNVCRAVKGQDHLAGGMTTRVSFLDRHARTGKPLTTGLALWHVDTSFFKDKLARLCNAEPGDPAQWHLPGDVSDLYLEHLTAEHKVAERNRKTGERSETWKPRPGHPDNHYLDAEVYGLAGAEMLKISLLRRTGELAEYRPRSPSKAPRQQGRDWIRKGEGWLR